MQTRRHQNLDRYKVSQRAAFTLVETLIVATLIGLLAFIAIPNYLRSRANASKTACISNLRQIDAAVQQWAMELRKSTSTTVTFPDIAPYLRYSVVCPAGGTSFSDSYSLATVASEPICLKLPMSHIFPGSGLELVTTGNPPANPPGYNPPSLPPGTGVDPGTGNGGSGSGSGDNSGGNDSAARPPRLNPPGASHPGNGSGNGHGTGSNSSNSGGQSHPGSGAANGHGGIHTDASDKDGKDNISTDPLP